MPKRKPKDPTVKLPRGCTGKIEAGTIDVGTPTNGDMLGAALAADLSTKKGRRAIRRVITRLEKLVDAYE